MCSLASTCFGAAPAAGQDAPTVPAAEEGLRSGDVSWDVQVEGGLGLGLDDPLGQAFFGRLRLGVLWLDGPLTFHVGLFGEAGGLTHRGGGLAVEVNHVDGGWWLRGGMALGEDRRPVTSINLGYEILGTEWQHEPATGRDALLLTMRSPIGLWWVRKHRAPPRAEREPATPLPPSPEQVRAQGLREAGERALREGRATRAEELWLRADALAFDAPTALRIADLQVQQGRLEEAAQTLRNLLLHPRGPLAPEQRHAAQRRLADVLERISAQE